MELRLLYRFFGTGCRRAEIMRNELPSTHLVHQMDLDPREGLEWGRKPTKSDNMGAPKSGAVVWTQTIGCLPYGPEVGPPIFRNSHKELSGINTETRNSQLKDCHGQHTTEMFLLCIGPILLPEGQ